MDSTAKINNPDTSYKIGFSSSLSDSYYSAYNEISKWNFDKLKLRKLHRYFLNGCKDGYRLRSEVKRELEAEVISAD